MKRPFISIVIPTRGDTRMLERTLSAAQLSARESGFRYEIILVCAGRSNSVPPMLRDRFPNVKLRTQKTKNRVACMIAGATHARGRIVIFLSEDVVVKDTCFARLIEPFDAHLSALFAVAGNTMNWWDGEKRNESQTVAWRGGRLTPVVGSNESFIIPGWHLVALNRRAFLEHVNFCVSRGTIQLNEATYRAAKSGLDCRLASRAIGIHHNAGDGADSWGTEKHAARDHLLFEWALLGDTTFWVRYCARLPISVFQEWLRGRGVELTNALLGALKHFPRALRARAKAPHDVLDRKLIRLDHPER